MTYSPKLKMAMEEIKAILEKNDITGFIAIHTPEFVEFLNHVKASYSCAFVDQEGALQVRLKTDELPGGKAEAHKLASTTYNMFRMMSEVIAANALGYMEIHDSLQEQWGGEDEGPGEFTSHQQQNN